MQFTFNAIGIIHSPFKEKFTIPRQAGLVPEAVGTLELLPPYDREEALRGLEDFSHVWLVFVFHQCLREGWKPTVRPPRLGGNERLGVFSTRAPFRPNPIGLSAVELDGIIRERGKLLLRLKGLDLLEGTPVIDIKPYLPYADALPLAQSGFAPDSPQAPYETQFTKEALVSVENKEKQYPGLQALIERCLAYDPRPAYKRGSDQGSFAARLYDFDLRWRVDGEIVTVLSLQEEG